MSDSDFDRRFGGLRRLFGQEPAHRLFQSHVAVIGIGGVGSWVVEALARSGVSRLTLVDMDHVAESNINRQVHATSASLGQAKVLAMAERVIQIHPQCVVNAVDDFVTPDNWPGVMLQCQPDVVVDACDQVRAKVAMAAWAIRSSTPFVSVGAAGGKTQPQRVEVADLLEVTHDPLLAKLRYQLRRSGILSHASRRAGVVCVFSRESVAGPDPTCGLERADGSLSCRGYGSSVAVTATFGMAAAGWATAQCVAGRKKAPPVLKSEKSAL